MRRLLLISLLTTFLFSAEEFQAVEAHKQMDWDRAVRFCFNIGGRMPSVEQLELAFKYKQMGTSVDYKETIYWSRTDIDLDAALSFDFSLGLAYPDHKANRYNVMCVR